jgi:uncharacterized protein YndB with AHSA1/START domain
MKAQKSIEISAPPERIWPFFVEPDKVMQWCITFKKFEYTSVQRSGVGTPIFVEEQAGGSLMKIHFEAVDWEENKKIAWKMVSGSGVKAYLQSWSIEIIPSGSRFSFMEEIELPYGILGKIIGIFAERMSGTTLDKMLPKLKGLAEA